MRERSLPLIINIKLIYDYLIKRLDKSIPNLYYFLSLSSDELEPPIGWAKHLSPPNNERKAS